MRYNELQQMYELETTYWWFVARRRLVRSLIRQYVTETSPKTLDVGCGTGGTMAVLGDVGRMWGCDISPDALHFCRRQDLRGLVCCAAQGLSFCDESFDVVLSCDVLEHVAEDGQAMLEMYRILRPGGIGIITVPALQRLWSSHDEVLHHLRRYHKKTLREQLAEAGFRIVKLTYAVTSLLPVIVTYRLWQKVLGRGAPGIGIVVVRPLLNRFLIGLLGIESWVLRWVGLPWGCSLVAVVTKPGGDASRETSR